MWGRGGGQAVSDTPRTDAVWELFATDTTLEPDVEFSTLARQLERELNAANDRVMLLEEAGIAAIHEAIHGREDDALEIWRKAMNSK